MKLILLTTIAFFCLQSGHAQSGELDSSFGLNGSVSTNFSSLPGITKFNSIAVQSDGKIVAAGTTKNDSSFNLALARYNADGTLDKTFSGDGKVTTDSLAAAVVAVQEDGKILVAGSALARYNSDGSIDSTFSNDGMVTGFTDITSMAIQNDGKILVAGNGYLARYNTNGSKDKTFAGDGKVEGGEVQSILIQSDAKIITVGYDYQTDKGGDQFSILLARYTADGSADSSFNNNGLVNYPVYDDSRSVGSAALQHDGKIVISVSGPFLISLIRFNDDGTPDLTFNTSGQLTTLLLNFAQSPVVIQNDEKILVAGSEFNGTSYDFAIVRYNNDGTIDNSFGVDGYQQTKITSEFDVIFGLVVFNNKLFAAGTGDYYFNGIGVVAGYTLNGAPDLSFGEDGIVETTFGANRGSTTYVSTAVEADGKIVVAGNVNYVYNTAVAIARYNTNGTLDNTFNSIGELTTDFDNNGSSLAASVAIQKDQKILVAGSTNDGTSFSSGIVRYNADGTPDTSFNSNGRQVTGFDEQNFTPGSLAIQNDGKIVVAGTTSYYNSTFFALIRYKPNGTLDSAFGINGKQTTPILEHEAGGVSVAIQNDQKIVIAGYSTPDAINYNFVVARFKTNGSPDSSFNGNGIQSSQPGIALGSKSLAIQPDGKIIVAGNTTEILGGARRSFFTLCRYNTNGSIDKSFDKDGKKEVFKSAFFSQAMSVAIEHNGKIFASGFLNEDGTSYPAFAAFNFDGSMDTSFSGVGTTVQKNGLNPGEIAISNNEFYFVSTSNNNYGVVSRFFIDNNNHPAPKINLSAPSDSSSYTLNENITLKAIVSSINGTVTKVEFFNGVYLLFTATDTPYTIVLKNLPAGSYTFTARATDNDGFTATSAPVHITVTANQPPLVNITSPASGTNFITPGPIMLTADASDPDGTIRSVDFYSDSTLLFTEKKLPYSRLWESVPPGSYYLTAVATDNSGLKTTSAPVHITVLHNRPPVVNITSPGDGTTYTAPATVVLSADAVSHGGKIKAVKFYSGTTLIHTEENLPYLWTWKNVPAGNYRITAEATDSYNRTSISAPVTITISSPVAALISSGTISAGIKTGINDEVSVQLSPNPARNILNIYTTGLQQNGQTSLSVISASGVLLKTMQTNSSALVTPLNISSLANGVYIIKIISGDKVIYRQFVKL